MSTLKTTLSEMRTRFVNKAVKIDHSDESKQEFVQQGSVTSLQIDYEHDIDCDPYNRTGQFCTADMRKYK